MLKAFDDLQERKAQLNALEKELNRLPEERAPGGFFHRNKIKLLKKEHVRVAEENLNKHQKIFVEGRLIEMIDVVVDPKNKDKTGHFASSNTIVLVGPHSCSGKHLILINLQLLELGNRANNTPTGDYKEFQTVWMLSPAQQNNAARFATHDGNSTAIECLVLME